MSVESEILRIQHNIASAYAKVAEKGGEVPSQPTSAKLAAAVSSIPQTLPPPDNNPIGTIISFMGTSAPKDYLVCDGAEYSISQYPALASFFETQFGAKNHFGGDGTATFAAPDMRNLFLRGYHSEAEEQLSGEVGERQEGTQIPYFEMYKPSPYVSPVVATYCGESMPVLPQYQDKAIGGSQTQVYAELINDLVLKKERAESYTARPVNMAVLYCIKAVQSIPAENAYSTEETRIGTWIDGKPLYRKVYTGTTPSSTGPNIQLGALPADLDNLIDIRGMINALDNGINRYPIQWAAPEQSGTIGVCVWSIYLYWQVNLGSSAQTALLGKPFFCIIEYTKTTDQATASTLSKTAGIKNTTDFALDLSVQSTPSAPVTVSSIPEEEE